MSALQGSLTSSFKAPIAPQSAPAWQQYEPAYRRTRWWGHFVQWSLPDDWKPTWRMNIRFFSCARLAHSTNMGPRSSLALNLDCLAGITWGIVVMFLLDTYHWSDIFKKCLMVFKIWLTWWPTPCGEGNWPQSQPRHAHGHLHIAERHEPVTPCMHNMPALLVSCILPLPLHAVFPPLYAAVLLPHGISVLPLPLPGISAPPSQQVVLTTPWPSLLQTLCW